MEDYRAGLQVENLLIELYRIEIVQARSGLGPERLLIELYRIEIVLYQIS